MAESISIVMKMTDDISGTMRSIASSSVSVSKQFEEMQRKAQQLGSRYDILNKEAASTSAEALKVKKAMDEAAKTFKKSGEEADKVKFENLKQEVRRTYRRIERLFYRGQGNHSGYQRSPFRNEKTAVGRQRLRGRFFRRCRGGTWRSTCTGGINKRTRRQRFRCDWSLGNKSGWSANRHNGFQHIVLS